MKYGSKQHKFLKKLLVIKPGMTVGEAGRRVSLLNDFLGIKNGRN